MKEIKYAYCNECEDLVEFDVIEQNITEQYKGENVKFKFRTGRCRYCGSEVATDVDYNTRRSKAKIKAYKQLKGIIKLDEISEILEKYDIGKEALADIAGFGKVTIKRYYEGFIPAKEYSDRLLEFLNKESSFINAVEISKNKVKPVTYRKITARYERLCEIGNSKTEQIVNYIVTQLEEVTPLALEKLLAFSNGVNYALNGDRMIDEECQAWQHGPVYPVVYNKYKKFGYKPIDDGIHSSHGCMLSKVSQEELKAIDMVLDTFGLYSPKTLETISHKQTPWIEKRRGYGPKEASHEVIDEKAVKVYYIQNKLNSEEQIMKYILECLKRV
ncbi:DUF4065 domain-containing protein [Blautia sp. BIOML-A1]|uniref:type II toxin-antitoxin system antitoxin SocA domain-containing protein n=1 Tax=Blautia sp. BIOML-A1 TaxID=2584624 RepID=UPI00136E3DCC|nr:type II toxin-antitoxin system antitoxin SocA domain-containing protein [Blautia sp. BIOML-A1]MZT67118.1 DUF4065 domain-containing protein [Blautia sp. BIOML-A1]